MNADKYIGILDDELIDTYPGLLRRNGHKIFMQDGATSHSARETRRWLEGEGIETITWPP